MRKRLSVTQTHSHKRFQFIQKYQHCNSVPRENALLSNAQHWPMRATYHLNKLIPLLKAEKRKYVCKVILWSPASTINNKRVIVYILVEIFGEYFSRIPSHIWQKERCTCKPHRYTTNYYLFSKMEKKSTLSPKKRFCVSFHWCQIWKGSQNNSHQFNNNNRKIGPKLVCVSSIVKCFVSFSFFPICVINQIMSTCIHR